MRHSPSLLLLAVLVLTGAARTQTPSVPSATATCYFDDDKQLVVNYERTSYNLKKPILGREIPYGKVWAPGNKPLTLFTNTPVEIGGKTLPMGAYTMFMIPSPKQWTLVVSRSANTSGAYDENQDIVRVRMESGELPSPQAQFAVSFAHVAPDQCSIRFEVAETGNFAMFLAR